MAKFPSARIRVGEGAKRGEVTARRRGDVFLGACRRERRRGGLKVHSPAYRSTARRRGDVFLGACRRGRRRGGLKHYQLRAAWGATGQLSGIWLGLWVSASGGAAQSASILIWCINSN